jgi:hypothetical protein
MGADIHAHVEIKVDGEWHYYGQLMIDRDYALFAKMAGVRNTYNKIQPMFPLRGLPEDISFLTSLHRQDWGVDGHSDSWISSDEYQELSKWYREEYEGRITSIHGIQRESWPVLYLFGNSFRYFKKFKEDYPDFVEDFRVVFWFDN